MSNPVLVEVTRGSLVESVHRGSIAVADAAGKIVFSLGDLDTPVYPRSFPETDSDPAAIESGAADAFGLGDEEIALACASHSGEPCHCTRPVASWLTRIGCGESDLACGAQPSRYEPVVEGHDPPGREADPHPQQLFRQAYRLPHRRATLGHRDQRVRAPRPSGPKRHRENPGRPRRRSRRTALGHRWLRGAPISRCRSLPRRAPSRKWRGRADNASCERWSRIRNSSRERAASARS